MARCDCPKTVHLSDLFWAFGSRSNGPERRGERGLTERRSPHRKMALRRPRLADLDRGKVTELPWTRGDHGATR